MAVFISIGVSWNQLCSQLVFLVTLALIDGRHLNTLADNIHLQFQSAPFPRQPISQSTDFQQIPQAEKSHDVSLSNGKARTTLPLSFVFSPSLYGLPSKRQLESFASDMPGNQKTRPQIVRENGNKNSVAPSISQNRSQIPLGESLLAAETRNTMQKAIKNEFMRPISESQTNSDGKSDDTTKIDIDSQIIQTPEHPQGQNEPYGNALKSEKGECQDLSRDANKKETRTSDVTSDNFLAESRRNENSIENSRSVLRTRLNRGQMQDVSNRDQNENEYEGNNVKDNVSFRDNSVLSSILKYDSQRPARILRLRFILRSRLQFPGTMVRSAVSVNENPKLKNAASNVSKFLTEILRETKRRDNSAAPLPSSSTRRLVGYFIPYGLFPTASSSAGQSLNHSDLDISQNFTIRKRRVRGRYRGKVTIPWCNHRRISVKMLLQFFTTGKMCGSNVVRLRYGLGRR